MTETIRLRLDLSYDGADFYGWAIQPGRRTVAGVLLEAFARLVGAETRLGMTVAGRTDAGVHATGQVCHVDLPVEHWTELSPTLLRRLAALVPPDARVRAITPVPDTFDARFSATFRRYEYRVSDTQWGPEPLRRHDTLGWPRPLDLDRLNAAAAGLVGEHDFAAFCKRKEHATTIRAINRLDWRRDPDGICVATVRADAFCQAMVRSLVGAMLAVGDGRRGPEWPAKLLTQRERSNVVVVAPARGLTLVEVGYPDVAEYRTQAVATRRLRSSPVA
ncbi:tRNA pseudouridine(38-40) synthase TruA [Actinoplanes derwentensis]|uniref:tRNA pseudouridine synthase A n=1 Tax=Actinoplanes derwentensis TaxID=113562 RepID=A0A1H2CL68_9ACTN|nr:tRNA pseudouridine(38-40) synthase TruA [Actinoplanes derwentensis]GID82730.1 tRNA pseudouridine synthase A [Actinoplanes derwentensis]SDT71181.1 tRNA pseudouridine38-40 synthase [Actinoplanes derwentensis]